MAKENLQKLYDDLYANNHRFKKLAYDVFENTDISKNQAQESKNEMQSIMTTSYYQITTNQEALEIFDFGLATYSELKRNKNDLKHLDQFDWIIDSYLQDLHIQINNMN